MKVLAIETATEACSAAYADDDQIIERFQIDPKGHSERILPMVESVLSEAGVVRAELEAIVFDSGPGSFTRSEERRVGKECRSRWSPYH